MGDFSLIGGGSDCLEAGFDYSNTRGTAVTSGGTVHTVGSYVELLSAANNDRPSHGIFITITVAGSQGDLMFNIALGGSGSEVDIVENLFIPNTSALASGVYQFFFPCEIPSGQRISINSQGDVASSTSYVHIQLIRGGINDVVQGGSVDTLNADTSTTEATVTVNAAGTANTFGSWTELVASTSESYKGFVVATHKVNGSMTAMNETYQIAVGASSSEEVIFSGHFLRPSGSEYVLNNITPFIPVAIPEGSRLSARVQADNTNTDAHLDFVIYGVR